MGSKYFVTGHKNNHGHPSNLDTLTGPINFQTGPIAGARASTDVRYRSFMAETRGGGGGGGCRTGKTCSVGHPHCQVGKWVELEMSLYCGS